MKSSFHPLLLVPIYLFFFCHTFFVTVARNFLEEHAMFETFSLFTVIPPATLRGGVSLRSHLEIRPVNVWTTCALARKARLGGIRILARRLELECATNWVQAELWHLR